MASLLTNYTTDSAPTVDGIFSWRWKNRFPSSRYVFWVAEFLDSGHLAFDPSPIYRTRKSMKRTQISRWFSGKKITSSSATHGRWIWCVTRNRWKNWKAMLVRALQFSMLFIVLRHTSLYALNMLLIFYSFLFVN